jgi:hypothetical protein
MPCDTRLKPNQTISQRAEEVRRAVERLSKGLASGLVKVKIGPQGAVAFEGLSATERDGVTDNCLYRRVLVSGSALAKAKLTLAEHMAGRKIDKQAVAQGWHQHGSTWHKH